jgi:hypothetical protein
VLGRAFGLDFGAVMAGVALAFVIGSRTLG